MTPVTSSRRCRSFFICIVAALLLDLLSTFTALASNPSCQVTSGAGRNSNPTPTPEANRRASRTGGASDWNSPVNVPAGPTSGHLDAATNVAVSVTPSTIDELFTDSVQVSVNGLATGDSVRVEKFQVNNNTGTIDAGAILEQSFLVKDGVSNLIGGIANTNLPADTTPADGSIVANINFLDESVPNTVGEYVFRFSSPTNVFPPMTARFTVTPVADAQNISGAVTANGAPVPNAYVVLLNTEGGGYDFYAATIADATGHYSFGAEAGDYDLVAAQRGFVGAFGQGVGQNLSAGQNKTVNIAMEPGTRTISGLVRDNKTGSGLPAVQIVFKSQDDKFTVDYTDANGNFSTSVTPGTWDLEIERNAVNQIGYVTSNDFIEADTTSGNATGLVISLSKATALIYGTITNGTNPIPQTEVDSRDESGKFSGFTATDANGHYVIAIGSGVWALNATAATLQETDDIAPPSRLVYVTDGQAVQVDFTAKHANARIQGALKDNTGTAVSDIGYRAVNKTSGHYTDFGTLADGNFDAAFADGIWSISPVEDDIADTDLIFVLPPDLTLTAGQTLSGLNFEAVQPTRQIVVQLNDDQGTPYGGALLHVTTTANGKSYESYGYTDDDGQVSLPAFDGSWTLIGNGPELAADGFREVTAQTVTVKGSDLNVSVQLQLLPATGNTLVNLSTRGTVESGDNVLIGGFIIPGVAPKKVLIRAIGPSLTGAGVSGALSDPVLTLFDAAGNQIAFNDDWVNSPDKQAIIDTKAPPTNDKESAIIATLLPGNYTAKVAGAGSATGVALVELYDLASFSSSTLANISTRGRVNQGENVLIAGYIVGGYKTQRVVVRAIGPSLTQFAVSGALSDPFLELHNAQGATIASNNDWQDSQKQDLIDTTLAPSNSNESAIVTDLVPGNYTAVVSGFGGDTGVGLAEVYNITPR